MGRRWLAPEDAAELGRLDPEAIARVRSEAWPDAANPDELHDALVWLGFLDSAEIAAGEGWTGWLSQLANDHRATRLLLPPHQKSLSALQGGEGGDPSRSDGEGEVGVGKRSGIPHLTPTLSAPEGGAGDSLLVSAEQLPQFLAL